MLRPQSNNMKKVLRTKQFIIILLSILLIPLLGSAFDPWTSRLWRVASEGDPEATKECLAKAANVNAETNKGRTVLMNAIFNAKLSDDSINRGGKAAEIVKKHKNKHSEVVKVLLAHGADVNAKEDRHGYTAIHYAASLNNTEIMETLIAHGADVNAKTNAGLTAIILATFDKLPENVKILINNGADVNLGTRGRLEREKENALMLAERMHLEKESAESAKIVDLLKAAGAKPIKGKEKKLIAKQTPKAEKTVAKKNAKKSQEKPIAKKTEDLTINTGLVTEVISYDDYGLYHEIDLYNINGEKVAKKIILRSQFNPTQVTGMLIKDKSGSQINYTEIEPGGNAKNRYFICLDKDGNLIKKNNAAVLVKPFQALQKTEFEIKYKGAFTDKKLTKFHPCNNCPAQTGIRECVYVW